MISSCLNCNKTFKVRPSKVKRGEGKYCSKQCCDTYSIGKSKKKKDPYANCDVGKKYGRYTIISFSHSDKYYSKYVNVICDCGNTGIVPLGQLRKGNINSCGCYHKEIVKDIMSKTMTTHGKSKTKEYKIYKSIKGRCYNKKLKEYKYYGGRGIKICDRWLGENGFEIFLSDMGLMPTLKHTLDRYPNVNGDYEPNNCRWATMAQQSRNRRSNRFIEYNGEKMIVKDFAGKIGKNYQSVIKYLSRHSETETINHFIN